MECTCKLRRWRREKTGLEEGDGPLHTQSVLCVCVAWKCWIASPVFLSYRMHMKEGRVSKRNTTVEWLTLVFAQWTETTYCSLPWDHILALPAFTCNDWGLSESPIFDGGVLYFSATKAQAKVPLDISFETDWRALKLRNYERFASFWLPHYIWASDQKERQASVFEQGGVFRVFCPLQCSGHHCMKHITCKFCGYYRYFHMCVNLQRCKL